MSGVSFGRRRGRINRNRAPGRIGRSEYCGTPATDKENQNLFPKIRPVFMDLNPHIGCSGWIYGWNVIFEQ